MKLSDKVIDALPIPTKGHDRYPSDKITGLNAQITSTGERGFVMRATLHGRDWFYTIGHRPSWTTRAAEYRAMALRRLIDQGLDPKKVEAQERRDTIAISEFWRRVYSAIAGAGPKRFMAAQRSLDDAQRYPAQVRTPAD